MIKGNGYTITKQNLASHELIGLNIEVKNSFDRNKIGLKGRIVDESKNTFTIESVKGEKKIPKKEVFISFNLGNELIEMQGKKLQARPEDIGKAFGRKSYGKRK